MRRAIELAERGRGQVSPNPLVGAVVVQDGEVLGEGWHTRYGSPHAEVEALSQAGEAARGATIYISLEPCSHHGKTPPCTEAILAAGVRRVVYASSDPDSEAAGGGRVLRDAGLDVSEGVEAEAARMVNGPFFRAHDPSAPARPWTELKLALSLDGKIADRDGRSTWITGDASRAEVHRIRAGHDAIAVGIGTAVLDDPILTVRGGFDPRIPPTRVVFDRTARLPRSSRLVRSARENPLWVVCAPGASPSAKSGLEADGVRIIEADDLESAMGALRTAGVLSLLCEGGAQIGASLLRKGLVDRLTLFIAPLLLGSEAVDPFREVASPPLADAPRWKLVRSAAFGADTLISVEP
jgi:diaminohydroxyphosphoribosylaminopyrimidine deaminase / 5-amino-6-(5-phosphoribosylamino)uracil reductase